MIEDNKLLQDSAQASSDWKPVRIGSTKGHKSAAEQKKWHLQVPARLGAMIH